MDFDFTTETITPDSTNILTIGGSGGIEISVGSTAERPISPVNGTIRYNTDISLFEFYQADGWVNLGSGAGTVTSVSVSGTTGRITSSGSPITTSGTITLDLETSGVTANTYGSATQVPVFTVDAYGRITSVTNTSVSVGVTSVAATQPSAGLTISGSPITSSGTLVFALANDLAAIEGLGTTGIAVRTASDAWTTRTISAGTGISVSNGNGLSGNPTISNTGVLSFSAGTTGLTPNTATTGAVTLSGTLNAVNGGTGQNSYAIGDILYASSTTALSKRTIGTTGQVLTVSGGLPIWTSVLAGNATGTVGVSPSGGGTAWTLVSGNQYRADFVHNLGTTNVVVTLWDTSNNAVVIANSLTTLDTNTVRIQVTGNTKTIKVVVVANGAAIVAGGSTPSSVITAYEGVTVSAAATKLNFTGQAVGVTDAGSGTTNISIGSRFTFFANSLDTPVNSDFAVNAIAATVTDPTYPSLNVRSFSNTVEQGVGCLVSIPPGATNMTVKIRGRAQTAPGVASVVQPRLYARLLPNNSAVGAWSAAKELTNISIPTNANFQYYTYSATLASLTLTASNLYQFEFTRRVAGVTGTNLGTNFLVAEITIEFA